MEEYKPYLMCDNSEKDGHAEAIMDYVISWCLRCTKYSYVKKYQPVLYRYCKYMLCKLLGKLPEMDKITIEDVRVWKQERYIDLWIEVDLYIEKKEEHHAILIEDKYYKGVHDNQLLRYKKIFDDYYAEKTDYSEKTNRHYALITCLYKDDAHYEPLVKATGDAKYDIYHFCDLADGSLDYKESESDIYNELFIRGWV